METGQEIGQAEGLPNETIAPTAPAQKLYTVEEVNNLVAYKKAETVEKMKKQYESQGIGQQAQNLDVEAIAAAASRKTMEELEARAREEDQRIFAEQHARNQAALREKLLATKPKYEDFDKVISTFNGASYPDVVAAAAELENAGDVLYALSQNKEKAARLQVMADKKDYVGLKEAMDRVSKSIIQNEEAKKQPKPAAPYTKMKPGVASASSGDMGIDDFARAFRH